MFTEKILMRQISKASSHDELKAVGIKLYKSNLDNEKRTEMIKAYRAKRRELDRAFVDSENSNKVLGRILYRINTVNADAIEITRLGKQLFESEAVQTLSAVEKEIMWRAYRYQKAKKFKMIAEAEERSADIE